MTLNEISLTNNNLKWAIAEIVVNIDMHTITMIKGLKRISNILNYCNCTHIDAYETFLFFNKLIKTDKLW